MTINKGVKIGVQADDVLGSAPLSISDVLVINPKLVNILVILEHPSLTHIAIFGDGSVKESSSANYTATAHFSDGSMYDVTISAIWNANSLYVSVDSGGVLHTDKVLSDKTITVKASYTYDGVTKEKSKNVVIKNISTRPGGGASGSTNPGRHYYKAELKNCGSSISILSIAPTRPLARFR